MLAGSSCRIALLLLLHRVVVSTWDACSAIRGGGSGGGATLCTGGGRTVMSLKAVYEINCNKCHFTIRFQLNCWITDSTSNDCATIHCNTMYPTISSSNALTKSREMKAQFRTLTGTVQLYCYERRRLPPANTHLSMNLPDCPVKAQRRPFRASFMSFGPRKTIHKYMVQCPLLPSIPPTLIPSTTPPFFFFSPAHVTWSSTAAAGDSFPSSTCVESNGTSSRLIIGSTVSHPWMRF